MSDQLTKQALTALAEQQGVRPADEDVTAILTLVHDLLTELREVERLVPPHRGAG